MFFIDFASGTHGHYLQYVINNYILGVNVKIPLFTDSGSSHHTKTSTTYNKKSLIDLGHFTSVNKSKLPNDYEKIILINHNVELDFILLVNGFNRCHGDLPADSSSVAINKLHSDMLIATSDVGRRKDWYHKLLERDGGLLMRATIPHKHTVPVFLFDYASFFNINDFYKELQKVSDFLNDVFVPTAELAHLHKAFLGKNRGYIYYNKAQDILNAVYLNLDYEFESDWQLQAFININLTKTYNLHSGSLFQLEEYPTNAKVIHKIIQKHIKEFDDIY